MLTLHTRIALLTLLPILLWASVRFTQEQKAKDARDEPVLIGIEHTGNAALTLTRTVDRRPQLFDVTNERSETIRISLPAEWERGEVRGAPLTSITADEAMFGYRRWHLPGGATLSFRNPLPGSGMTVHNPSGLPLRLRVVTVDLGGNTTQRASYLLSDQSITLP